MRRALAVVLACAWSAVASAWTLGESRPIVGVPSSVAVIAVPGGAAGTGPEGTWIARGGQVRVTERGGAALAVGGGAVWVCAEDGLWRISLEGGFEQRSDDACEAVGWAETPDGPGLLVAGERLAWWPNGEAARPMPGKAPFLVVGDGERVAWVSDGEPTVSWRGPLGDASLAAGGPVQALALADGTLGWVADGRLRDATGWSAPLGEPVAALAGFGPGRGGVQWVWRAGGAVSTLAPGGAVAPLDLSEEAPFAVAWLDSDRCPDLVLGGASPSFRLGRCGPEPLPRAGAQQVVTVGRPEPIVSVSVGDTLQAQLAEPGGRPARWEARTSLAGFELAPEGALRFTPTASQVGRHRVSLRIDGSPEFLGAGALWVVVNPARVPPPPEGGPTLANPEPKPSLIGRSCGAGVGLAGGLADGQDSWETLGRAAQTSASFAVAVHCTGGRDLRWFIGWDSAPLVRYVRPSGTSGMHLLGVTLGLGLGDERLHASLVGTVGVSLLGVGARVEWLPFGPPERASGFDLRVQALFPGAPAGEAMLLYTWRVGGPPPPKEAR